MAVTVTANLQTATTSDAETGWSGNSGGLDDQVYVQGSGSYTWQASKNSRTSCTFTPATNIDLTDDGTGTGTFSYPHVYFWIQCAVFSFAESKLTGTTASSGLTFRLTDGSGNYREWHVAGSDTWGGEWKCFVIDPSNTDTDDVYASSGTLDLTDIDIFTWSVDISNSGTIRIIDNVWNDAVRYGEGLTLTGTDFDLTDATAVDESTTNRYGILQNIDGVIFSQGRLQIGNAATTTTFNSDDEVLVFRDRPISATVATGAGLGIVHASLYELVFTGSGCTAVINGLVCKSAGLTDGLRHYIDASSTDADVTIDGSTFIRSGLIDFSSTSDIQNTVFNNCFQIDTSTGVFHDNSIGNYVGTEGGSVLFPSTDTNFYNLVILNCDHGIEYVSGSDSTSPTFNNIVFDDAAGNFDVNNTSGGAITIGLTNGANANSYTGSAVTFESDPVTTQITVKDINTGGNLENARVLLVASDATGAFPYQESVTITRSTSTATVAHTGHGLKTGDFALISGATQDEYNGAFEITYIDANSYSYTVPGTPTTPATGTIISTGGFFNTLTNSSGVVTDSRSISTDQPVVGRVRLSSGTSLYRSSPITATVDADTGFTLTVQLIPDD